MIDVPVLVKDSLRNGNLKKNYKFKYIKDVERDYYELIGSVSYSESFTVPETGKYMIGESSLYNDFTLYYTYNGYSDHYPVDGYDESTWQAGTVIRTSSQQDVYQEKHGIVPTEFTIENDRLVNESVLFDERLCSGDTLKFGLCEGTSLEFQCFNTENILGYEIKAFLDVRYIDSDNVEKWYRDIPMGTFTVTQCSRQASTGIIKVTAYNKLMSNYLDRKVNDEIIAITQEGMPGTNDADISYILAHLLEGFSIDSNYDDVTTNIVGFGKNVYHFREVKDGAVTNKVLSFVAVQLRPEYTYVGNTDFYKMVVNFKKLIEWQYENTENLSAYYQSDFTEITSLDDGTVNPGSLEKFEELVNGTSFENVLYNFELYPYIEMVMSSYYPYSGTAETDWATSLTGIYYGVPCFWRIDNIPVGGTLPSFNDIDFDKAVELAEELSSEGIITVKRRLASAIEEITWDSTDAEALPDVTLRELQSAVFEVNAQFGQLDRTTDLFSGVELNRSRLLPADTLYPSNTLYPDGAQTSANKSMYSKLWADEGNIHKWRYLIITYKAIEDGNEVEKTLQRTVNADGTDDYNMSDNWLFKNLVWTAEDVGTYADAMVAKMQDITWFPFEMWCAGLPYLETGDEIEIPLGEETYTSYVLQRQLKGIQNLQDTYINGTLDIF